MLKLRYWCVFLLLGGVAFAQAAVERPDAPPAAPTSIVLADGMPVGLRLARALSSTDAKPGEAVPFEVVTDVSVGGAVLIARHAQAFGTVAAVQTKRRGARRARLDITMDRVQLVTGREAQLRARQGTPAPAVSHADRRVVPLVLPLLFLQHGKELQLRRGTRFTAYVNGSITVDLAEVQAHQPAAADATVYVYRARDTADSSEWPVYCTGRTIGQLKEGRALQLALPPGEYWFRSSNEKLVFLNLQAGEEYYLRMVAVPPFAAEMRIMPADTGENEFYELPPATLASFESAPAMKPSAGNAAVPGGGSAIPPQ